MSFKTNWMSKKTSFETSNCGNGISLKELILNASLKWNAIPLFEAL